jgi:hypothetical protein
VRRLIGHARTRARAHSLKRTKEFSRSWGPLKPRDVSYGRDKSSTALTLAFSVAAHPAAPLALPHTRSRLLGHREGGGGRELRGADTTKTTADVGDGGAGRGGDKEGKGVEEREAQDESVAATVVVPVQGRRGEEKESKEEGKGARGAQGEKLMAAPGSVAGADARKPPPAGGDESSVAAASGRGGGGMRRAEGAGAVGTPPSTSIGAALQEGCKREFATPKMVLQPQTPGASLTGNVRGKGRVLRDDSPSLLPPPTFAVTRILEQVCLPSPFPQPSFPTSRSTHACTHARIVRMISRQRAAVVPKQTPCVLAAQATGC